MNEAIAQTLATATQHFAVGQLDLASACYASILARDPNHVEALSGLGVIASQTGNYQEAIRYFTRGVAAGGASAFCWNNLGVAHTAAGNLADAAAAFEEALRARPDFTEALNNLGVVLEHQKDLERAAECHRQAIRVRPGFAPSYFNLGNVLKKQGKREEAMAAYTQGLKLNPDHAEAHNDLGTLFHEQGDLEGAANCYRQALIARSGYADASSNLATTLKEQGLLDEALAQFHGTLELQPDHPRALANLSQFVAEGRYRFGADDLARLEARLASGQGSAMERSLFAFTLATVFDQQGAVDEAFAYYRQANELRRGIFQASNRAFDAEKHRAAVDHLVATFDRAYFSRVHGWGVDTELPVFVVGMPRSGSTLLEQILASHPQVHGAGEFLRIIGVAGRQESATGQDDPDRVSDFLKDRATAQATARTYLRQLAELGGPALRVIDKALGNFLYLGVIAALFPRARVIHCRRDPLDVCLSCYIQNFKDLNFVWSLEDIGAYHRQYERVMGHWSKVLPLRIHEVRYEDLVACPEEAIRNLVAHCGLSWDERCLAFHNNPRPVQTASTLQVRRPLSARSIGRWKRYRAHLAPLLSAMGQPSDHSVDYARANKAEPSCRDPERNWLAS
jgi:tetratricopeptide (TPR) repeat protein